MSTEWGRDEDLPADETRDQIAAVLAEHAQMECDCCCLCGDVWTETHVAAAIADRLTAQPQDDLIACPECHSVFAAEDHTIHDEAADDRARLAAIEALHRRPDRAIEVFGYGVCPECHHGWPCPTLAALGSSNTAASDG